MVRCGWNYDRGAACVVGICLATDLLHHGHKAHGVGGEVRRPTGGCQRLLIPGPSVNMATSNEGAIIPDPIRLVRMVSEVCGWKSAYSNGRTPSSSSGW